MTLPWATCSRCEGDGGISARFETWNDPDAVMWFECPTCCGYGKVGFWRWVYLCLRWPFT